MGLRRTPARGVPNANVPRAGAFVQRTWYAKPCTQRERPRSKETLSKALSEFEGTMIFASHDRQLLGALSSRVLEPSAEGSRVYDGGYREYVAPTGRDAPGVR